MQRLQEATSSLTAVVEWKQAYAFGYIAPYLALLSVAMGIASLLPK